MNIIKKVYPNCIIDKQVRVGRFKMDLKVTNNNKTVFIEFDGYSHFAISRYGIPRHDPFRKKHIVEDKTGIEVINWAYWIQRCEKNVKAIFDINVNGLGVLWNTNIHFGDFYFDNSADIINKINKRFNLNDGGGVWYFYIANTQNRNNPEHPIINKILNKKVSVGRLLPKGYKDKEKWLPNKLLYI